MTRVNIINDLGLEYLYDDQPNNNKINNGKKQRFIKINEDNFKTMLEEGLIKKTNDGYVFVGKHIKKH